MPLQSRLFSGDPKLEAAATSDAAHVTQGMRGDHVMKIQAALVRLDGASIVADGIYGLATAAAVLAYKKKRDIINRTYQSQADSITGKMTIAAMDAEMASYEKRVRIEVDGCLCSYKKPLPHDRQHRRT
jgi:peptidoglycan hydrolase-like protein with peptidoglycan-binding domain